MNAVVIHRLSFSDAIELIKICPQESRIKRHARNPSLFRKCFALQLLKYYLLTVCFYTEIHAGIDAEHHLCLIPLRHSVLSLYQIHRYAIVLFTQLTMDNACRQEKCSSRMIL